MRIKPEMVSLSLCREHRNHLEKNNWNQNYMAPNPLFSSGRSTPCRSIKKGFKDRRSSFLPKARRASTSFDVLTTASAKTALPFRVWYLVIVFGIIATIHQCSWRRKSFYPVLGVVGWFKPVADLPRQLVNSRHAASPFWCTPSSSDALRPSRWVRPLFERPFIIVNWF